jgi:hypothetical protein
MIIESTEIVEKISNLVDSYFTKRTRNVLAKSNSIRIRHSLEKRVGTYFTKSLLNDILKNKKFKFEAINDQECIFNIAEKDIKALSFSDEVIKTLKQKNNLAYDSLVRVCKLKDVDCYKYTFRFLIKIKFCHCIDGINFFSERQVYEVISKELGVSREIIYDYFYILNHKDYPEIPENIMRSLLEIFNISYKESITNSNYTRKR